MEFEIYSLDKIKIKNTDHYISYETAINMINNLDECINWISKWDGIINIMKTFKEDIKNDLDIQTNYLEEIRKLETKTEEDNYYHIHLSIWDFFDGDSIEHKNKKFFEAIESSDLNMSEITFIEDEEIITLKSKTKEPIILFCGWYYDNIIEKKINNIKKIGII